MITTKSKPQIDPSASDPGVVPGDTHGDSRLATTGGFVAEEGEGGPLPKPPGHPAASNPTLRVAGKR